MPGEIDPSSDPPTDALIAGVAHGPLRRLAEKAAARRDTELRARSVRKSPPAPETMWVKPAGDHAIYDINGVPYPRAGAPVLITDTYAHRRLRDGSLLLSEVPKSTGVLAAQEDGDDAFTAALAIAAIQRMRGTDP